MPLLFGNVGLHVVSNELVVEQLNQMSQVLLVQHFFSLHLGFTIM